ncbi:MAG TPA: site-specific integrase [Candidatus Tectomicrobia bacterium]
MPQGKQAKILTPKQEATIVQLLQGTRYPSRDRVMFLLSMKAGLRAKEIALLTWGMVTDAEGQVAEVLALENRISKGHGGGRLIPLNATLRQALIALHQLRGEAVGADQPVITSERGGALTASSVTKWFFALYHDLGMRGCSSHSGRRTFITRAARHVSAVGGSLRDVQQLAGHASLQTTQRYIDGDTDAQRQLVQLL